MKNEKKDKVTITINGMDPQQWQEEKEGRVAVIFISDPADEDEDGNVLNGYTLGNGGRMVSMMKYVFKCCPSFKEIIHLAMVRQFVGDVMDDIFKSAVENVKPEKKEE